MDRKIKRRKRKLLKRSGNQFDTIKFIKNVSRMPDPYILDLCLELKDRYPGNRVAQLNGAFKDVFNKTRFVKDPLNIQTIRTPSRLIRDGLGNCVDYSCFMASVMNALKIPGCLKMISFDNKDNFSHIYTVTRTTPSIYMDPVIGQNQDGSEIDKPSQARKMYFNREVPHVSSFELEL